GRITSDPFWGVTRYASFVRRRGFFLTTGHAGARPGADPFPASTRSLDDDRLAERSIEPDRRPKRQDRSVLYRAQWRAEGRRREAPGLPAADAGQWFPTEAGAHPRDARALRQHAHPNGRVPG